jgi:D-alanyl-D-alanine-carboxypeptidase/D-alanyl-D-alanine-endopeptidase
MIARSFALVPMLSILMLAATDARAEDKLLTEAVEFSGALTFLSAKVPGFVIAAVRNGETAVAGFGEISDGSGKAPDGDTLMRVGSISKVFCGAALAGLVADGSIKLTDRLQDRLGWDVELPTKDGREIRVIDLVTHASGLPREVPRPEAPETDPFATNTREALIAGLQADPLLFAPGTGALYSNWGFDLLGATLASVSGKPYATLLEERVFAPLGMKDSVFNPRPGDETRLMQGHNFDGSPMPAAPTPIAIECAGGLHTTPNDMLAWMKWHLDRFATEDAEMRLLDHASYLYRDGLVPAAGFDEGGGEMDAIGLGWVIMMPEGNRPLILQKTGGLQGMFAYVAIAPTRGVGVFVAMNEFNIGGLSAAIAAATGLIAELAPR